MINEGVRALNQYLRKEDTLINEKSHHREETKMEGLANYYRVLATKKSYYHVERLSHSRLVIITYTSSLLSRTRVNNLST